MKAYKHLIKFALSQGHTVSVWDGEEWQVSRSKGFLSINRAVESVEEAQLRIRDKDGKEVGWALVSAFGLDDDETVIDNTINPFMTAWEEAYYTTQGA
jgi:hypothetical protein